MTQLNQGHLIIQLAQPAGSKFLQGCGNEDEIGMRVSFTAYWAGNVSKEVDTTYGLMCDMCQRSP